VILTGSVSFHGHRGFSFVGRAGLAEHGVVNTLGAWVSNGKV